MSLRALGSLLLALVLALAGCSQEADPPSPAAAPSPGGSVVEPGPKSKHDRTPGNGKGRPGRLKAAGKKERTAASDLGDGRSGPGGAGDKRGSDRKPAGPSFTTASASRPDPSGDGERQGETPSYTDIRRAAIQGLGKTVRFSITVDGAIPGGGTEDGEDMTASFRLQMPDGDEHQIYALGSPSGWSADFDNTGRFPGRFAIEGDRFVFELPWSRLGGPDRFKWLAQTSWTRSPDSPLDDVRFAFDQVPEYERASYPD